MGPTHTVADSALMEEPAVGMWQHNEMSIGAMGQSEMRCMDLNE